MLAARGNRAQDRWSLKGNVYLLSFKKPRCHIYLQSGFLFAYLRSNHQRWQSVFFFLSHRVFLYSLGIKALKTLSLFSGFQDPKVFCMVCANVAVLFTVSISNVELFEKKSALIYFSAEVPMRPFHHDQVCVFWQIRFAQCLLPYLSGRSNRSICKRRKW